MTPSKPLAALQPVEGLVGPKDLTVEEYREYVAPSGSVYRIDNHVGLYYREGGTTHRVVDSAGIVHCVPFPGEGNDVILRWKNKVGDPVGF